MSTTIDRGGEDFARLAEPFRRELIAYGYRMLGSVDDAEEVVQDVYLDAWRAYDRFEGRSSLRTWLYAIATRAFVKAVERRKRRPLPSDLHAPAADPTTHPVAADSEVTWLQPAPDSLLTATTTDPGTVVAARESMRLAFVAALQLLPPRQRVVLILRDVLCWSAAEVATLLDLSVPAVNSALQRARARVPANSDSLVQPSEPRQRELLDRYVAAFQNADVDGLVAVLTEDAIFEMPPFLTWFWGAGAIGGFLGARMRAFGSTPVIRTTANGQPAVALYPATADGQHRLHALHVLTLVPQGVGRVVSFQDVDGLRHLDLPRLLPT
ncbi:sigma-70 family RNA polymerase sigma factor [Mycobacterium paraense]|uniref:sigma-70 family RNA polymerase sigma factor n=1 Tax=Mycobacterium paraense TaxID=767916 RepID=UPI000A15A44F|nr:sigma-70 family RNA polymerase sigma factor [Mycobacterium paraense]MCV7445699.1 sigma-70 family RNA polymerase sigma factor [Mycobacterium paraense]ORW37067.1 RNA polymerase subunit sigma-70 [Mycobacterium paraense]